MKNRYEKRLRILGKNEEGFVLVLSLSALVTLSIIGVWAMSNSSVESRIAGSHQRYEEGFQVAEGAVSAEGGELGFTRQTWYEVPDPNDKGRLMVPTTANDFDPFNDDPDDSSFNDFNTPANSNARLIEPEMWPYQNITRDAVDNEYDYRYLVTYLYDDDPPKGTGEDYAGYKFKINSNKTIDLELGGIKLGPKVVGFED